MPCSDPVMSERDKRASDAARLVLDLSERGWIPVGSWVHDVWLYPGGDRLDELTRMLCNFCEVKGDEFIYNGRDRTCRRLADWWDAHKASAGHLS